MAKQAKNLRGFKLARYAYEKLQALRIPPRFQEAIDLGSVTIRSKPFHDYEVSVRACVRLKSAFRCDIFALPPMPSPPTSYVTWLAFICGTFMRQHESTNSGSYLSVILHFLMYYTLIPNKPLFIPGPVTDVLPLLNDEPATQQPGQLLHQLSPALRSLVRLIR